MTSLGCLTRIKGRTSAGRVGVAAHDEPFGQDPGSFRHMAFLWASAIVYLLLHLATASRSEFYIDEMSSSIVLPRHTPMGYVDGSAFPLSIWLEWPPMLLLGCTRFALRLTPAIAGSINILVAGLLARELGGKRFAISLTGLSVLVTPFLLFTASTANSFSFESLPWCFSAFLIMRILRTGNQRLWWLVGMAWGAGLMNKPTMVLFLMSVGLGLLLTQARIELFRKGYWISLLVAAVCFSPALIWQAVHGWPVLHFGNDLYSDEWADSGFWLAYFSRTKMLLAQPALLGPLNVVLVAIGVSCGIVFVKETAQRTLLWAVLAADFAFIVTSGRIYYPFPTYSILLPFGCIAVARLTAGKHLRWIRHVLVVGLLAQGLLVAPLCVPVLSRGSLDRYSPCICRGVLTPLSGMVEVLQSTDKYEVAARKFSEIHAGLPENDKKGCCIIIGWAEMAAGIEFYSDKYHLPHIFSPHRNFAFWGSPGESTGSVLAAWFNRKELEDWFRSVEYVGRFEGERTPGIFLCKSPKHTYTRIWREMCEKDWAFRWKVERYIGNGEDPKIPIVAFLGGQQGMVPNTAVQDLLAAVPTSASPENIIPPLVANADTCLPGRQSPRYLPPPCPTLLVVDRPKTP